MRSYVKKLDFAIALEFALAGNPRNTIKRAAKFEKKWSLAKKLVRIDGWRIPDVYEAALLESLNKSSSALSPLGSLLSQHDIDRLLEVSSDTYYILDSLFEKNRGVVFDDAVYLRRVKKMAELIATRTRSLTIFGERPLMDNDVKFEFILNLACYHLLNYYYEEPLYLDFEVKDGVGVLYERVALDERTELARWTDPEEIRAVAFVIHSLRPDYKKENNELTVRIEGIDVSYKPRRKRAAIE